MPLYKYMSADVAQLFVGTLKVRFTQPSDLNDPFEFQPLIDFEGTAEEVREVVEAKMDEMLGTVDGVLDMMEKYAATDPNFPLKVPIEVLRKLIKDNPDLGLKFMAGIEKNKAEVLDKMEMTTVWEAQWQKFQQALGQALGIFSLSEDPTHQLMWSHYASNHFGIAVEFDDDNPWFHQQITPNDDFRHLVQVTYVKNPPARTWKQLIGSDVLYTKNSEWAYEREWRIIRPLRDGTEVSTGKVCFDVPPDAVRCIVFGCRTTPALEKKIRDSIKADPNLRHVRFKRAKLAAGGKIELVEA